MDAEHTIAEIEWLERIFARPGIRPLSPSALSAANRRHNDMLAHSPWFQLWQRDGVCCRPAPPVISIAEIDSYSPPEGGRLPVDLDFFPLLAPQSWTSITIEYLRWERQHRVVGMKTRGGREVRES